MGEWVPLAAERAAVSPPGAAPPQAPGETGTAQSARNVVAGALQLAALYSRSSGAALPPGPLRRRPRELGPASTGPSGDRWPARYSWRHLLSKSSGKVQTLGRYCRASLRDRPVVGTAEMAGDGAEALSPMNRVVRTWRARHESRRFRPRTGSCARATPGRACSREPRGLLRFRLTKLRWLRAIRPYVRISERSPRARAEHQRRGGGTGSERARLTRRKAGRRSTPLPTSTGGEKTAGENAPHLSSPIAPRMSEISGIRPSSSRRYVMPINAAGLSSAPTARAGVRPRPTSRRAPPSRTAAAPVRIASGPQGREGCAEIQGNVSGAISVSTLSADVGYKGTDSAFFSALLLPGHGAQNRSHGPGREMAEVFRTPQLGLARLD